MSPFDINLWLRDCGVNPHGKPLYQLIFSDDSRELRSGEFNEFYGPIFLRTVKGTKLVKKYPFIKSRFILERWAPPEVTYSSELPDSKLGDYVPIFVFDRKGEELPLRLDVIRILVHFIETGKLRRTTSTELTSEQLEREEMERKYFEDSIDSSPIVNALSMGEGIGYGINKGTKYHG